MTTPRSAFGVLAGRAVPEAAQHHRDHQVARRLELAAAVAAEVAAGKFRQDLLFRLNTIQLHLPPLRARAVAVPAIAAGFQLVLQVEGRA